MKTHDERQREQEPCSNPCFAWKQKEGETMNVSDWDSRPELMEKGEEQKEMMKAESEQV